MGDSILKGVSAALLVTVITLLAGLFWTAMGYGGLSTSTLVDIGLIASCVAAGYVAGRESGQWLIGGISSLGYVLVCVLLVGLFLELKAWGVVQVLAEGGLIGILSAAYGAGSGGGKKTRPTSWRAPSFSSWENSYSNSRGMARSRGYEAWDDHVDDWDELLEEREVSYKAQPAKSRGWRDALRKDEQKLDEKFFVEEDQPWERDSVSLKSRRYDRQDREEISDEEEWESWLKNNENKVPSNNRKAWWEEEIL